jgi:hypothetical protein
MPIALTNIDYCVPLLAAATPSTICVPPSNWISCLAPSRMLEADVVAMAMLPVLATRVPAVGTVSCGSPGSPPVPCGALLAPPAEEID